MAAIQAEKETAMRRYRRLQQVGRLLRCLEAVAALLLLSWSSARVPAAARLSADFLRRLAAVLLSPRFVFLLGNAIVLLLFAKSGQLSPSSSSSSPAASSTAAASSGSSSSSSSDIYEEFLECRGGRLACSLAAPSSEQAEEQQQQQQEEDVYEDKEVCVETRAYRRSRSERMERRRSAPQRKLHRSETDLTLRKFPPAEAEEHEEEGEEKQKQVAAAEAEDAEEFRRAVEAFIARQTKFHREECMAATFSPPLICSSTETPPQQISLQ